MKQHTEQAAAPFTSVQMLGQHATRNTLSGYKNIPFGEHSPMFG
jgi:hypothetical protein